jgi:hypothetical protein
MPTTPNRGYVIPELAERPYFTKIVTMFNAMDTDMALALRPYHASLLSDSATIANTTTRTKFNKSLSIPSANLAVAGAQIAVRGRLWTTGKTTGSGAFGLDVYVGADARLGYLGCPLLDNTGVECLFAAEGTIRTTGATGSLLGGPSWIGLAGQYNQYHRPGSTFAAGTYALNTTAAQTVDIWITFDTADVANTAYLQNLMVSVNYPNATVA